MTEQVQKKAMQLINARPMSKGEMVGKLMEKGIAPEDAAQAADWLEEHGAIDDRAYAAMLVEHYSGRGYGERRIESELYRHKVDRALWAAALSNLPDMDEAVDRFIRMRLKGERPDSKELKRVSDALARRGFSWDEINAGLYRYGQETGEDAK